MEYFGDLDETAEGDPDGDGLTNIEEYEDGTDPTQEDTEAPVVSSLATVPTQVRTGVDYVVTLVATADDRTTGNSRIAGAEYFVGALGAAGTGRGMAAADGVYDEALEGLTAAVSCGSWTSDTTLYVRAVDALGFWSDAESITVAVVDGKAPSAVRDLSVSSALKFEAITSQAWETIGTLLEGSESTTIDLGSVKTVGAVSMTPAAEMDLFPSDFTIEGSQDEMTWTQLGAAVDYRASLGTSLWMNAAGDYQYIRITAESRYNRRDRHYYVKVGDITVYETTDSNQLRATWHATADDDNTASSGAASEYDVRYSDSLISGAGFDAATQVTGGLPAPGVKGTLETTEFSIGSLAGKVYVALKVGDEIPNWSSMSNVADTEVKITGLQPVSPEDAVTWTVNPVTLFTYVRGTDIKTAYIAFSDRGDFPRRTIGNADGTKSQTVRFPLKVGVSWKPSAGQWRKLKALGSNNGTLYWRLEGRNEAYRNIYGPTRTILLDAGAITDLVVTNSHAVGVEEGVWPEILDPPVFSWTDGTLEMRYFHVDVSTDDTIPLKGKTTVALCGKGVPGGPYKATNAEWKKIRKLASTCEGVLYWRVRALDVDRAFVYTSAVKEMVVDGGEWVLDALDLSGDNPEASWTHTGEGIVGYGLQFCGDDTFPASPRYTLKVPSGTVAGSPYMLTAREKARLVDFAGRYGLETLYWRVRGQDADKSFITYSTPETTAVP